MTALFPFECRWGIMATGWIAKEFAIDLFAPNFTRHVSDVTHRLVAVASSSSLQRATDFISTVPWPKSRAYGSYTDLVRDPEVNVIYIATPHSHHFANVMMALKAGKHVLCEKAFTVNAAQLELLIKEAKERQLFLMEAVWTRFFPVSIEIRKLLEEGEIGVVKRVEARLDFCFEPLKEKYPGGENRMVNPKLAGGALLDLGIYALTWVFQTIYHDLPEEEKERSEPKTMGVMQIYSETGVDADNVVVLQFPHATGVASSSLSVSGDNTPCARILGTKGEIQVTGPAYRPEGYCIICPGKEKKIVPHQIPGRGMFWEADEVARCIRDGMLESKIIPLNESLVIMRVMDTVRRENGLRYPEEIETTVYDDEREHV
ncbi:hypothetical protein BZA77DRAFT_241233 [Pyronema omphalodes]|nr:hypothetical protein BZA77DRAFT_241233 [Pyronema omphalodes]